jgi:anti-sigma factor RsiW
MAEGPASGGSGERDLACRDFVAMITAYLEGALPAEDADVVRAHLDICPGCSEYLTQMRTTIEHLGHVPVESLSEQARDDIVAAFRASLR